MRKEFDALKLVQDVNIELRDFSKSNGTMYLYSSTFHAKRYEKKAFVDNATDGRHPGLSTFYNRHNLFHQRKFARDVEPQNAHIVRFKPRRDEMQVSTPSENIGLGSELVEWFGEATSVPYRQLITELSSRRDVRFQQTIPTGRRKKFCKHFSIMTSSIVWYQPFVSVF